MRERQRLGIFSKLVKLLEQSSVRSKERAGQLSSFEV